METVLVPIATSAVAAEAYKDVKAIQQKLDYVKHLESNYKRIRVKDTTNPDEISWRISIELECKRCLLLLDEVLDKLDLCRIGIHDNRKDSKVVLATRYRDICFALETDGLINVKRISEADAWKIFTERVGQNVNLPCIEPIAKLVVRECAGLPLLID
ncbi:probable disease resistance protein At4g27220 [Fagus crenata]